MKPNLSYIVCSSPRSGSSMLCDGLWSTNIAGRPAEYFNPGILDEIVSGIKLGVTDDDQYVEKMIEASTTDNGVFGMKLHAFQTTFLLRKVFQRRGVAQISLRQTIEEEFPSTRYIYLSRENKVAQAVSYYRALRTNEWWRFDERKPVSPSVGAYYELGIRKLLMRVRASDAYWEGFFEKHNITPLRLTFDDVTKDYERTVRRALDFLGLNSDVQIAPPSTHKISDSITAEWERKFRESGSFSMQQEVKPPEFWAPF